MIGGKSFNNLQKEGEDERRRHIGTLIWMFKQCV